MSKERYFQFPLFLLRELLTDKNKALNNIIDYGIFSMYLKSENEINDIARQVIYLYYRNKDTLPDELLKTIEAYIKSGELTINEEYCGFGSGGQFNVDEEVRQLLGIFSDDKTFSELSENFYSKRQTFEFFNLEGNIETAIAGGKRIHNSIPDKEPMPMISKKQLFEFRDNEKSEFEIFLFATTIAIRSILGKKACCLTNKAMIISRAFGFKSPKQIPPQMPDLYYKYNKRYHADKILQTIEIGKWNLFFYAKNTRGLYVAYRDRITLEKLAEISELSKDKTKIDDLKLQKEIAMKKAKAKIEQQRLLHINNST